MFIFLGLVTMVGRYLLHRIFVAIDLIVEIKKFI
jgi:hypothetical protein